MRIPGFAGAGGGETKASDAAVGRERQYQFNGRRYGVPISLLVLMLDFSSTGSGVSALMVEVDVVRLRGFFKGPKWVSLNSVL